MEHQPRTRLALGALMSLSPRGRCVFPAGDGRRRSVRARDPLGLVLCPVHVEEPGGDRWASASSGSRVDSPGAGLSREGTG